MTDAERFKLLYGPYTIPVTRRGRTLFCEIRGTMKVGGYTDGLIPWPRVLKVGQHTLIVTTELARAIRLESVIAIAHHWGVSRDTVTNWRKSLGVHPLTPGTSRILRESCPEKITKAGLIRSAQTRDTPEFREQLRKRVAGKSAHPNTKAALLQAARKKKSNAVRRVLSEAQLRRTRRIWAEHHSPEWDALLQEAIQARRSAPVRRRGQPWLPAEVALLGLSPDPILADALGRSTLSVRMARCGNGIRGWKPALVG